MRPDNLFNLQVLDRAIRSAAGGRFFHAVFITSKGKRREMSCRLGVKKHLVNPEDRKRAVYPQAFNGNLTVWDTGKQGYRSIPLARLKSITINGTCHEMEVR